MRGAVLQLTVNLVAIVTGGLARLTVQRLVYRRRLRHVRAHPHVRP